ncbi:MAG: SIR2 family NAD-dependent protein deacylase [Bacteroidota bacterium]
MAKKRIVVLSGAGISAESGIKTFRDSGGLWEEYDIMEVASLEGWHKNMSLVNEFYNQRRKQLQEVKPNAGHYALVKLEEKYDVQIITQNVDDLHEQAGSKNVLHLHGELKKVRSSYDEDYVVELEGWELKIGDKCPKGHQLRPHIVWFGEPVPMIYDAAQITATADVLLIIGTSLNVYPAASLVGYVKPGTPVYLIDPGELSVANIPNLTFVCEKGSVGVPKIVNKLLKEV